MNDMTSYPSDARRRLAAVLLAGVALAVPGKVWPQETVQQTCTGPTIGTLGIARVDCRGRCAIGLRGAGRDSTSWTPEWSFSVEPRIVDIAQGSPAAGALQTGDRIVAVDGFLITTEEGGRRFANVMPDSTVTIRFQRDGRARDASLRATRRCGPGVEGAYHLAFPAMVVDSLTGQVDIRLESGIFIQSWNADDGTRTVMSFPGSEVRLGRSGERAVPEFPESRYGMNFACGPCSSTRRNGRNVWRFQNPIEVLGVAEGGPADLAGLRVGDRITHLDGVRIDSARGGDLFSSVQPGVPVQLTVAGPDGAERTTTLVPRGRD